MWRISALQLGGTLGVLHATANELSRLDRLGSEQHAGAAAVCGWVLPIPEEHAALPAALRRRAALEDRFLELKVLLEVQFTGKEGHEQTPGASLAFRPEA